MVNNYRVIYRTIDSETGYLNIDEKLFDYFNESVEYAKTLNKSDSSEIFILDWDKELAYTISDSGEVVEVNLED